MRTARGPFLCQPPTFVLLSTPTLPQVPSRIVPPTSAPPPTTQPSGASARWVRRARVLWYGRCGVTVARLSLRESLSAVGVDGAGGLTRCPGRAPCDAGSSARRATLTSARPPALGPLTSTPVRPAGSGRVEERGQGPGAAHRPQDALLPCARPSGTQPVLSGRLARGAGVWGGGVGAERSTKRGTAAVQGARGQGLPLWLAAWAGEDCPARLCCRRAASRDLPSRQGGTSIVAQPVLVYIAEKHRWSLRRAQE